MKTKGLFWGCLVLLVGIAALYGCGDSDNGSGAPVPTPQPTATATPTGPQVFVYWDQNEEEDALTPSGQLTQIIPPWDPNGQMCVLRDGSGRFVTGYNPTLPGQHNPGSVKPLKNPPVGLALWDRHGNFTGQTLYVPGPYALPGSDIGADLPPDPSGAYNDNGSFTGCAVDSQGHVFGADIGQAQGSSSSPDQGRIIEWFPPDYTTYCIIVGPTQGGDGPHHVNGTGGLRNPGLMAVDPQDDLYVPESGNARVLRFDHSVIPATVQDCGADGLLSPPAQYTQFIRGGGAGVPAGIARDPSCSTPTANCWAVTNILSGTPLGGGNAVSWFDNDGHPTTVKGPIPSGSYTPFGIAVGPSGEVFFIDIALNCGANGCGTLDGQGGLFRVDFTGGVPSPAERVAGGFNFPTSVTVCDASTEVCPEPLPAPPTPTPCTACAPTPTPACGQTGAACVVGEECCSGQCVFHNQCQ